MPARAEDGGDGVVATGEKRGDVIGLVEDALVEIGPAGVEEIFRGDGFAVEEGLIGTEGAVMVRRADFMEGARVKSLRRSRSFGGDAVGARDLGVAVGAD